VLSHSAGCPVGGRRKANTPTARYNGPVIEGRCLGFTEVVTGMLGGLMKTFCCALRAEMETLGARGRELILHGDIIKRW